MQSRGWLRLTVRGLDGQVRVRRRRDRCRECGRDVSAADGLLLCGRQRITRPLAQRACQLAALEPFTHVPQLVFDQHGVQWSHEELLEWVPDVGGPAELPRGAIGAGRSRRGTSPPRPAASTGTTSAHVWSCGTAPRPTRPWSRPGSRRP